MATTGEGTIEVELADFWKWISNYHDHSSSTCLVYGVPQINKENQTIEVKYAFDTSGDSPKEWGTTPEFLKDWKGVAHAN